MAPQPASHAGRLSIATGARATPADVVIVGAGATGGWAAKRLAEAGLSVIVLDAGRPLAPRIFASTPRRTRCRCGPARRR